MKLSEFIETLVNMKKNIGDIEIDIHYQCKDPNKCGYDYGYYKSFGYNQEFKIVFIQEDKK